MKRVLYLLVAVALTVAVAVPASAGAANHTPPVPAVPIYLALGNSLAVGEGASDPSRTAYVPVFHDFLRRELSCWPPQASQCQQLQVQNLGVSGATSATLIDQQLPIAVDELAARNGDDNPGNDVEVVTVDIGGNDVFALLSGPCAVDPAGEDCAAAIQTTFADFTVNYSVILGSLRAAGGPDTSIVVMTYYNPLPSCDLAALAPLADIVLEGSDGIPGLNDLIRKIAAAHGATVADTFGKLGADDLVGGSDCLHPDDSGYEIIAAEFAAAVPTA